MPVLKQFHYPEISQRRLIFLNAFISFLLIGWFSSDCLLNFSRLFPHTPVMEFLLAGFLAALLAGNFAGKPLFGLLPVSRIGYVVTEFLFIAACAAMAERGFILKGDNSFVTLYNISPALCAGAVFLIPFLAGVKNRYFLKVSCGIFFDEKKGGVGYLIITLAGLLSGFLISIPYAYFQIPAHAEAIPLLVLLILLFLIKAEYNPVPFYAQDLSHEEPTEEEKNQTRDDIFFTYLNFSYIVIYTFLAGIVITRYCGDLLHIKAVFLFAVAAAIGIGYVLATIIKRPLLIHIYCEVLYPFLFAAFYIILHTAGSALPFIYAILLFMPICILFGMTLHHSVQCVLYENDQNGSFRVLNISIFILPVPILIALFAVNFSQVVFSLFFYAIAAVNIIIPGIYLSQKKVHDYKKGVYFAFGALAVPLFVLTHLYFGLPFSTRPFVERVTGYNEIMRINYSADYLSQKADVTLNGKPVFSADDLSIRSMKRQIMTLALFADPDKDSVLFIDGSRRFYANPVQSSFANAVRFDYFPDSWTGILKLPPATAREIPNIKGEILNSFRRNKTPYEVIVDLPNLYDQTSESYRFSAPYYRLVKKHLTGKRIFAQTYNVSSCSRNNFDTAVASFRKEFPYTAAFLFSDHLILIGTDRPESLVLNADSIARIRKMIQTEMGVSSVFFSEYQCLSHALFSELSECRTQKPKKNPLAGVFSLKDTAGSILPDDLTARYPQYHTAAVPLVSNQADWALKSSLEQNLRAYEKQFTLLKKIEEDNRTNDYENETNRLLELRRYGEYDPALRQYAAGMLAFKESSYNEFALLFEKNKQWEDAEKIYRAILIINPQNFNANYRMSVLSLTLQDIPGSFNYLQTAMRLEADNPNVMHQMGVILFSTHKYNEALEYLQRAVNLKKYDASTYYYIGLCYEELGRNAEAMDYYQQAIVKEPDNQDISGSLKRIKEKMQAVLDQWKVPAQKNQNEVERGEDFPLPINKSAIDIRLKDEQQNPDDANLPKTQ